MSTADRVTVLLDLRDRRHDPVGAAVALTAALHLFVGVSILVISGTERPAPTIARAIPIRIIGGGAQPRTEPPPPATAPTKREPSYLKTPPAEVPKTQRTKTEPAQPKPATPKLASPEARPKAPAPALAAHPAPAPAEVPEEMPRQTGLPAGVPVLDASARSGVGFAADAPAFDEEAFDFPVYIQQMIQAISRAWYRPQAETAGCTVWFRIGRDGRLVDWRMEITSGLPHFDRAAVRALMGAVPLPPLPADFAGPSLGVHLRFQ